MDTVYMAMNQNAAGWWPLVVSIFGLLLSGASCLLVLGARKKLELLSSRPAPLHPRQAESVMKVYCRLRSFTVNCTLAFDSKFEDYILELPDCKARLPIGKKNNRFPIIREYRELPIYLSQQRLDLLGLSGNPEQYLIPASLLSKINEVFDTSSQQLHERKKEYIFIGDHRNTKSKYYLPENDYFKNLETLSSAINELIKVIETWLKEQGIDNLNFKHIDSKQPAAGAKY